MDDGVTQGNVSRAHLATARLSPGMGGRWEVQTRNTTHLWDLDAMTYTRQPGPAGARMDYDNVEVCILRVDVWPAVGARSLVWFDDPHDPTQEHWRFGSLVRSIRQLPSDGEQSVVRAETG